MPTPRKLRAASAKMAPPRLMVATTTRGAKVCGEMCWRIIRDGREPIARADSTYSASLADSTTERMTLVAPGAWVTAIAMITVVRPAPRATSRSMARMTPGKRDEYVKKPLCDEIEPSAYVTAKQPPRETDADTASYGDECHQERYARTEDDPAEDVSTQPVCAQRVFQRWWMVDDAVVVSKRVIWRDLVWK